MGYDYYGTLFARHFDPLVPCFGYLSENFRIYPTYSRAIELIIN
jgi:hypothetical protein